MNYELAKQLKDAGFPQEGKGGSGLQDPSFVPFVCPNYPSQQYCPCHDIALFTGELAYEPLLSELIKACGDKIYSLRRTYEKDKWVAHGYEILNTDIAEIHLQALWQKGFIGSTPEEAVAKLYLELYKK